jgi:uncharacterized phage protein gp47/JayE
MSKNLTENSKITDISVGSVSRSILETVALEIAFLYEQMEITYENGFLDTATGKGLDLVTGILGLERKSANFAVGVVTFSRENAGEKVKIMRGTRISTNSDDANNIKLFETVESAELNEGVLDVDVPIKAVAPGEEGMADFETITEMEVPVIGIDKVINKNPTTMGTERENDEEFRGRARTFIRTRSTSTSEAIRAAVLNIQGVRNVAIIEIPNGIAGEVEVYIDGLDLQDQITKDYKLVRRTIDKIRPAGISVNFRPVEIVRLEVRIYIRFTDDMKIEDGSGKIIMEIQKSVENSIKCLNIGEDLVRKKLISDLYNIAGVGYVAKIGFITKKFEPKMRGLVEDTNARLDLRTLNLRVKTYEL